MSAYISCTFDCQHKDIARNVFVELNKADIKTFYNGDIPDEMRQDSVIGGAIIKALVQSPVFIPVICQGFARGSSFKELAYAMQWEKCIVPIVIDGHYITTEIRNLIGGMKIVDLSSPQAFNAELPNLIGTLRTLIPVLVADDRSAVSAVAVAVEPDEDETEETWDDEEEEEGNGDESSMGDENA